MGSFNRDNRSGGDRGGDRGGSRFGGGGKSFGGGSRFGGGGKSFGGGGFGKPEMHDATCSQCGAACQVPFRPSGGREIFCSNCFKDKRPERNDGPMRQGGNFNRPSFDSKPSFDKKPSFGGGDNNQFKQQIEMLNTKLDKILKILSPGQPEVKVSIPEVDVVVKEVKKAKESAAKSKASAKKTSKSKK